MAHKATLTIDGKVLELPVIEGTEGELAIDITQLRAQTGYISYDPGFGNTGSCQSAITFIDGEKGILQVGPVAQRGVVGVGVNVPLVLRQSLRADGEAQSHKQQCYDGCGG